MNTTDADSKPQDKAIEFESSLDQLSQLVEKLESGQLSLEDSVNIFEKGIQLTRECQNALNAAEQRVEVLMQEANKENTSKERNEPINNE